MPASPSNREGSVPWVSAKRIPIKKSPVIDGVIQQVRMFFFVEATSAIEFSESEGKRSDNSNRKAERGKLVFYPQRTKHNLCQTLCQ